MGNPNITRLGKTQIWYKKYYSNLSYSNMIKKCHILEKLLNIFFKYGIYTRNNLFVSNFWYKNTRFTSNTKNFMSNTMLLYFRKYYYAHQTLTIEHSYFLRLKTPEFFPLRLYILKYNNWLVASVQWLKPLKSHVQKFTTQQTRNKTTHLNYPIIFNKTRTIGSGKLRRSKLFFSLLLYSYTSKTDNTVLKYSF